MASRAFASAEAFLALDHRDPRACVVADVRLPGINGLELVRRLKSEGHAGPIVVMTGHADVSLAVAAMKAGAADFLEKPFRPAQLIASIAGSLARAPTDTSRPAPLDVRQRLSRLTPRQREVLYGVVAGKLNKTIAHELGISVRTVEGYRAEIMARTGAKSVSELVRFVLATGDVGVA